MSLRYTSQVVFFDSQFRADAVLGGSGRNARTYQFMDESDRFLGQHHASILKDGTLLIYDNGGTHPEFELPFRHFTRAQRLRLDPITMKATTVWQFDTTRFSGLVSRCCGSASVIEPNGNVLTHTAHQNGSYRFSIFEADGNVSDKALAIYTVHPGGPVEGAS
jgi:hypothetical protein